MAYPMFRHLTPRQSAHPVSRPTEMTMLPHKDNITRGLPQQGNVP